VSKRPSGYCARPACRGPSGASARWRDRYALDRCIEQLHDVRDGHRLAHARQRRGHDLRAVQFDDQDSDDAGRIAVPDGGSTARRALASTISTAVGSDPGGDDVAGCFPGILDATESGERRLYRRRDTLRRLSRPVTGLSNIGALLSSKSAMKIFAPQCSALMTLSRSAGAGDRDPVIDQARGQQGLPPVAPPHVLRPGQEAGKRRPASSVSRTTRGSGSSARHGPNVRCSAASNSSAPAVRIWPQPASRDAPTPMLGTFWALLMRYPSQTCVRLAPQRRNCLTGTLVRDWQTIASWAAGWGLVALTHWPAEHRPGPPDASGVCNRLRSRTVKGCAMTTARIRSRRLNCE
jgi:hypothetical protein